MQDRHSNRLPETAVHPSREFPTYYFTPALEAEISSLDGIISSRVLSDGSDIQEIHAIAERDQPPKKLVRNIESLLLIKFGIRVDHRKISIVPTGRDHPLSREPVRPQILAVCTDDCASGIQVHVELERGPEVIRGLGYANRGETELHASARALIDAVEKLLKLRNALRLVDIKEIVMGGQYIIVVLVEWSVADEFLYLVGATPTREQPLHAAARATFDALNRKLVRIGMMHTNPGPVSN